MQASADHEELHVTNTNASMLDKLRRWEAVFGKTLEEAEAEKSAEVDLPAVADQGVQVGQHELLSGLYALTVKRYRSLKRKSQ